MCFAGSSGNNNVKPAGYALADSHKQVQMSIDGKDVPKQPVSTTTAQQAPVTSQSSVNMLDVGANGGGLGGGSVM